MSTQFRFARSLYVGAPASPRGASAISRTRVRRGLLRPHVEGYQGWLLDMGYTPPGHGPERAQGARPGSGLDLRALRRRAGYRRVPATACPEMCTV
jgi:hypothetical protein